MPGLSIRRLAGAVVGKLGIECEADHTSERKPGLDYMVPVAEPMANIRPGRDPRNAGMYRDRRSFRLTGGLGRTHLLVKVVGKIIATDQQSRRMAVRSPSVH
jgi:hypothetical protein